MRTALKYAAVAGAVGFTAGALLMALAISDSTSSTAAIGYIFIPFYALIVWGAPASLAGLCLGYLRARHLAGAAGSKPMLTAAWAVLALLVAAGSLIAVKGLLLSARVQDALVTDSRSLDEMFGSDFLGKNKFVLGAIAQNRRASPELLHQIASVEDPALHEAMGSAFFDLMGGNTKGLAVMRLVARHPNVRGDTLDLLAKSPDDYVLGDVAANPRLPESTIRALAAKRGYLIEWGVAANPKAPADLLAMLARSQNEHTREAVSRNPNAPRDAGP